MKASDFDFAAPDTIRQACEMLDDQSYESRIIAGGQTLTPMLAMRVAQPSRLIDISGIEELGAIDLQRGGITVSARVTQSALEDWLVKNPKNPILSAVIPWIAHRVIRNRGTVCGSIAHADPSGELPLALVAVQGKVFAKSLRGDRKISAEDFFIGALKTALDPAEFIQSVYFPNTGLDTTFGFQEFGYRSGDFAVVSVLVLKEPEQWVFCFGGIDDVPRRFALSNATVKQAVEFLTDLSQEITVREDPSATSEFRRHLMTSLGYRAIQQAELA